MTDIKHAIRVVEYSEPLLPQYGDNRFSAFTIPKDEMTLISQGFGGTPEEAIEQCRASVKRYLARVAEEERVQAIIKTATTIGEYDL